MVLWDRAVLPYPFDFDTCIKVKLDSSWRIHTNFPTLSLSFSVGKLGSTDTSWCCFMFDFNFPDWVRVFSEFRNLERAQCLSGMNLSTIGTMRRTAITVNYLQMLCLLVVLSSFFEELLLSLGYFFSSKSLLCLLLLVCLLSSKSCSACCVIYFWLLRRFYFTCGVAWLVGLLGLLRGDLLSLAF